MQQRSLMEYFSSIPDPRVDRTKKHKLIDILVITVCAVLSDCNEWTEIEEYGQEKEDWLKSFLDLPNGIPSHDTFGRVFSLLCPQAFQFAFSEWLESIKKTLGREIVSIDGKALRGSRRERGEPISSLRMVSAWAHHAGVCLGLSKSELKKEEGEPRAAERLIEKLYLKGCIVTIDAAGATQRITSKTIEKGGDYLIGLKKNQRVLLKFAHFAFETSNNLAVYRTQDHGHGREEVREYSQVNLENFDFKFMSKGWARLQLMWPDLKSFVRVKATRKIGEKVSEETRFYMSSLSENVEESAHAVRSHWGVENSLHWTLDVVFREDDSRIRIGHAAENLSLVRRMALNMLKHYDTGTKRSIKRKRKKCGWDNNYLLAALLNQPKI